LRADARPRILAVTASRGESTEATMDERVTGIGGIFFKAKDPAALATWYRTHLGIDVQDWGGAAFADAGGTTAWTILEATSTYFAPSTAPFMINYRVRDLDALLATLRAEGCAVDDRTQVESYGKFGWVMDPDGNKVELWQAPDGQ
jgi:predicted enzyme related to lactoylglutathione lyase